jgi:NitT/TauT family transport system ATP-binding protein
VAEIFSDKVIEVRNLTVSYKDACVLDGIHLMVRRGEFVSIIGVSGSGKTTLLNALAGFIPATGELNLPRRIGVVFQDYSVFAWMTVAQNIAFGLNNGRRTSRDEIVSQHLRMIRLEDHADHYPVQLSGGQMQRVAIARALAPNPDIILMDEPFGALDRDTRERMQAWLLAVWSEEHKTILFVTHDIEEAIFLSDRVLVLGDKRIAEEFCVGFERPRSEDIKFTPRFNELKKNIVSCTKRTY